jgi:hypothetical protein
MSEPLNKNNSISLRADEQEMRDLLRKSSSPERKEALVACYLLEHGDLLKKYPKDSKRHEYLSRLYDQVRPLISPKSFVGRNSRLLIPNEPRTFSPSHRPSPPLRIEPLTVDRVDRRIGNLALANAKAVLGHEGLSSPDLGGRLVFTATYEEGERVKIEITENSLKGLKAGQSESLETAIEEIEDRLTKPRVGMTEIRTHILEFSPPSR